MTPMPRIDLRAGYSISRIIRGGWQLSGDHGSVERARAIEDITAFYDAGITAFDCADIYTGVEEIYGAGLRHLASQRGAEAAREMKIHTKYVPDRDRLGDLTASDTRAIITRSLSRLGRERLDLVQFHWWDYDTAGLSEAVAHLAGLQAEGLIDKIGVTNMDRAHVVGVAGEIDLVSAQIQFSLLDRRPVGAFAAAAAEKQVALLCYGVLAGGFLTDDWLGETDPGFVFENRSLVKYRLIIEEFGGWDAFQSLLGLLRAIADRRGGDIAAVATRAMLDEPSVAAVIIGARYARHLKRLKACLAISLDPTDRKEIAALLTAAPGPRGDVYTLERDRDGRHGRIMKYNLNAE